MGGDIIVLQRVVKPDPNNLKDLDVSQIAICGNKRFNWININAKALVQISKIPGEPNKYRVDDSNESDVPFTIEVV
jgi:hypothetical protein